MLIKSLLIASSWMAVDGRQMLRNQAERDLAWGGDAHPVPVPVAPAKPSWKGDGNSAVPLKKTPVKGSGKKTLIMRKKKEGTKKQVVGMKPEKEPVKVVKIQGSKGNTVYVKPSKIRPAPVTSTKWGNDGFQPLVTPKPTQKPVSKWGNDGFQPLVTPKPTQKPVSKWGNDGFQPLVTPKPTKKPSSKWGNDGHCMYRPNADYTKCTNDDNVSSDYMYSTLEKCCEAVFGMGECDYEEVCIPCEEQLFFFDGDKCVNDVFFAGAPAYSTAVACCNLNFGIGSYANGSCDYIDVCAPEPVVTPAPTICGEMVFFLDGNTCTNDIYIADAVAYNNPVICCNVNFGPGSMNNGLCNVIDICNTPYPTPNPTPKPTPNPTPKPSPKPVTPGPTVCEEMVFFVDGNTCTNDIYVADTMSYNTAVACCNLNFGVGSMNSGNCNVIDICNPTPAPTPCEAQMFFLDGGVCTNENYIADAAGYATLTACCNSNFGMGSLSNNGCDYVDVCNPQPNETPEPTPSPTSCEERLWYIGSGDEYTICSNGYDSPSGAELFGSLADCCVALGTACYYEDVCNTLSPSYSPTIAATFGSTPTVSKETTGPPTMAAGRGQ